MHNNIRLKIGIILFLILLFSSFYFIRTTWSPNSRTRAALSLSIIEDGSLNINKYAQITVDKALYKGDYYADKAPGYSFTALPAVWAAYKIFRTVCSDRVLAGSNISIIKNACSNNELVYSNLPPESLPNSLKGNKPKAEIFGTHAFDFIQLAGTYFASGLVSAITALLLYFFALRIGAGTGGAIFAALTYGLATPAWVWSTAFTGHVLTGLCLFSAFAALYYLDNLKTPSKSKEIMLAALAGALLSWAVVVEYPAAIASVIIALYGLSKVGSWQRSKAVRTLAAAAIFAVIFILPLLIYNYLAFDSPFNSGYRYVTAEGLFTHMEEGFNGITYPRPERFYGIFFGGQRGLFWLSPILLFSPYALYLYWRKPGSKAEAITIIAVSVYYILWNSSYYYWHGGNATGPRHLVPILPFVCLPLSILWTHAQARLKHLLGAVFAISFLITLMAASVRMIRHNLDYNAVFDVLLPGFFEGRLSQVVLLRLTYSLTEEPKPEMLLTLVPLILVLALGGLYILKLLKQENEICDSKGKSA